MLQDRMWRKTRRPVANSLCYGADPNRNWDFHWMGKIYMYILSLGIHVVCVTMKYE